MRPSSAEFSISTRDKAEKRANGFCECGLCGGLPLKGKKIEFHHFKEAEAGGDNSLKNCRVVRVECHAILTAQFKKQCGKADRQRRANNGVRKPASHPIAKPPKQEKPKRDQLDMPPRRNLYERIT